MASPGTWIVTLTAEPSDVPAEVRLRKLLKQAWRLFRLKAVDVQRTRPEPHKPEAQHQVTVY